MARTPSDPKAKSGQTRKDDRETRLKSALKANLQRRKAQARARKGSDGQKD